MHGGLDTGTGRHVPHVGESSWTPASCRQARVAHQTKVPITKASCVPHYLCPVAHNALHYSVVICDRGVMDGKSFVSDKVWSQLLRVTGRTEATLLARYDLVVHMMTAAIGAERFYEVGAACTKCHDSHANANTRFVDVQFGPEAVSNPARFHNRVQAAEADKRTRAAWAPHPRLVVVDNSTGFDAKVQRVLAPICQLVGLPPPHATTHELLVHDITAAQLPVAFEELQLTIIALPVAAAQDSGLDDDGGGSSSSSSSSSNSSSSSTTTATTPQAAPAAVADGAWVSATPKHNHSGGGGGGEAVVALIRRKHGGAFAYTRRVQRRIVVGARPVTITRRQPIQERQYYETLHQFEGRAGAPGERQAPPW